MYHNLVWNLFWPFCLSVRCTDTCILFMISFTGWHRLVLQFCLSVRCTDTCILFMISFTGWHRLVLQFCLSVRCTDTCILFMISFTGWHRLVWPFCLSVRCTDTCILFIISFTGWHRRLNYRAGAAPSFYILIKVIHSEAREVNDQIRLVSELKLRSLQRKSYRSMQAKIFLAWER